MVHSVNSRFNNNNNNNGHDDDSVTTWGRHECEDDLRQRQPNSMNNTAQQTNAKHQNHESTRLQPTLHQDFLSPSSSSPSSTSRPSKQQETPISVSSQIRQQKRLMFNAMSPMTQTLNTLSQNMDDLRYDAAVSMLKLERPGSNDINSSDKKEERKELPRVETMNPNQNDRTSTDTSQNEFWKFNARKQSLATKSSRTIRSSSQSTDDDLSKESPLEKKQPKDKESKTSTTTSTSNASWTAKLKSPVVATTKNSATINETPVDKHVDNGYILWKDYQDKYTRHRVYVDESGDQKIGMRIQGSTFCGIAQDPPIHCRVLKTFGLATKHGIQANDWIAWPMSQDDDHVRLATKTQVLKWSKERPFSVWVLREKPTKEREDGHKDERAPVPNTTNAVRQGSGEGSNQEPKPRKRNTAWIDRDGFVGANADLASKHKADAISKRTPLSERNSTKKHPMVTPQSGKAKHLSYKQSSGPNSGRHRLTGNDESKQQWPSTYDKNGSKLQDVAKKKSSTAPQKEMTERKLSKSTSTKVQADTKNGPVAPYCLKCNTPEGSKAPRMHHAWCPHNDFFDNSGAKEIYQRMQYGLGIGCKVCKLEHELGKIQKGRHHKDSCVAFYKKLQEAAKDDSESEVSITKPSKKSPTLPSYMSFSSSSDESEDDADDVSCYRPQKKKQKIHTISLAPLTPNARKEDVDARKPKKHSRKQKGDSRVEQQSSSKAAAKAQPKKRKKNLQATTKAKCQKKRSGSLVSTSAARSKRVIDETLSQDDNDESESPSRVKEPPRDSASSTGKQQALKLCWVQCEDDPWGPAGYEDGDVLLYGPQEGIPYQSFMVSSQRFTLEPFSADSSYRNTHCTPEEGYSMLLLRREPLGRRPWGMKVIWDEFGHACLIDSVDPLSPAAAATYVGCTEDNATTDAGLRVNDMILSVNGKLVGGMTEIQLEVELETSGPNLLLVMSRYKHANHAKQKFLEVERRILYVMDSAARDDRLIGWTEIGNGTVNPLDSGSLRKVTNCMDEISNVYDVLEIDRGREKPLSTLEGIEGQHSLSASVAADIAEAKAEEEDQHVSTEYPEEAREMATPRTGREDLQYPLNASRAVDDDRYLGTEHTVGAEDEDVRTECPSKGKGQPLVAMEREYPPHSVITKVDVDLGKALGENQQLAIETTATVEKIDEDSNDNISSLSSGKGDAAQSFSPDIASAAEGSIVSERLTENNLGTFSESVGDEGDWENDPHAWNGCVCGATHENSKREVFWIQCDCCDTWYNVAAKCVGFSEKEAVDLDRWSCWGCPSSSISQIDEGDNTTQPDSTDFTKTNSDRGAKKKYNDQLDKGQRRMRKRPSKKTSSSKRHRTGHKIRAPRKRRSIYAEDSSMCPETPADDTIPSEMIGINKKDVYDIGDLVYVKAHSWPGKNCEGGIGNIIKGPYDDPSGDDPCYTVRFTVGSTEKNVEAEYISPYSFGNVTRRKREKEI